MAHLSVYNIIVLLYLGWFVTRLLSQAHTTVEDNKVLNVGEELWEEALPLKMGFRLYELHGLKSTWYEVKISYPASIPSSFSIHLVKDKSSIGVNLKRKLLNTEKLIFKVEANDLTNHQNKMYIVVSVEPDGVVAIPYALERESVLFNIVCDELLLGIPHKAWWVVGLVIFCLALAFLAPYFLPSFLNNSLGSLSANSTGTKYS
ncbi:hypothetical protein ACHQM5_001964 [Ranunculus cassubicifolius]